jgi:hypothetical protein
MYQTKSTHQSNVSWTSQPSITLYHIQPPLSTLIMSIAWLAKWSCTLVACFCAVHSEPFNQSINQSFSQLKYAFLEQKWHQRRAFILPTVAITCSIIGTFECRGTWWPFTDYHLTWSQWPTLSTRYQHGIPSVLHVFQPNNRHWPSLVALKLCLKTPFEDLIDISARFPHVRHQVFIDHSHKHCTVNKLVDHQPSWNRCFMLQRFTELAARSSTCVGHQLVSVCWCRT